MSETRKVGPSVPQQASRAEPSTQQGTPSQPSRKEPEPTGWIGWIMFAGMMMMLLGALHAFQGLVALFQDEYYLVTQNGLTVHMDYTAWGWTHLIVGAIVVAAGIALLVGQTWARIVATILALGSALVNIAFLAAYPIWSTIMVALDVLVVWALTVHGGEMRTAYLRDTRSL